VLQLRGVDGQVTDVRVTAANPALLACVTRVARGVRFPSLPASVLSLTVLPTGAQSAATRKRPAL